MEKINKFSLGTWIILVSIPVNIGIFRNSLLLLFILSSVILIMSKKSIVIHDFGSLLINISGIIIWTLYGINNGFLDTAIIEGGYVITTSIVVFLVIILYENRYLDMKWISSIMKLSWRVGVCLILSAIFILYTQLYQYSTWLFDLAANYVGWDGVRDLAIYAIGGFGGVLPVFSGTAISFMFVISFMTISDENKKISLIVMAFLALLCNQRYYIFFVAVILVYWIYDKIHMGIHYKRKNVILKSTYFLLALLLICYIDSEDYWYVELITDRFVGERAYYSDQTRWEQFDFLWSYIDGNIIDGVGMGGYIHDYIRSQIQPYNYELGWCALLMQFGFIGFLCIKIIFLFVVIKSVMRNIDERKKLLTLFSFLFLECMCFIQGVGYGNSYILGYLAIYIFSRAKVSSSVLNLRGGE